MDKTLWIDNDIEKLRKLFAEANKKGEKALFSYIFYMVRVLNGMSQMRYTQFLYYERRVLWDSMEVFTKYFTEEVETVLEKTELRGKDLDYKKELLKDIELAVVEISQVYRNIVDSAANADRQTFLSLSVDTNMYDISPKFCAFYSAILDRAVKMFDNGKSRYAFIINPSLEHTNQAKVLFEKRNESGKVVIVDISERMLEEVKTVVIFLMHEFFHVLSGKERLRRQRAVVFQQQMLIGVSQYLFGGVKFSKEKKQDAAIKEKVLEKYFKNLYSKRQEYLSMPEDSRDFYGKCIKKKVNDSILEDIMQMHDEIENIVELVFAEEETEKYFQYVNEYRYVDKGIKKLKKNITEFLAGNYIESLSVLYLVFFREIYADMGCVLTLRLCPEEYQQTFKDSLPFADKEWEENDYNCKIRETIVMNVISKCSDEELAGQWKEACKRKNEELENPNNRQGKGQFSNPQDPILNQMNLDIYVSFFLLCAEKFIGKLRTMSDMELFQRKMKETMNSGKNDILSDILLGNIDGFWETETSNQS